jgi:hypothetical protein
VKNSAANFHSVKNDLQFFITEKWSSSFERKIKKYNLIAYFIETSSYLKDKGGLVYVMAYALCHHYSDRILLGKVVY